MRVFEREEVALHSAIEDGIWVIYENNVYDITDFVADHPGGIDLMIHYAGHDVTELMHNILIHEHSANAIRILERYKIGELKTESKEIDGPKEALPSTSNYMQKANVIPDDDFIDLKKPLVMQVFFPPNNTKKKMTKRYYLDQVHCPRHLPQPAILFANPVLELLSRTPWWLVAMLSGPLLFYLVWSSLEIFPLWKTLIFMGQGLFLFSFIEYSVHRFLLHADTYLPDHQLFFGLHFMLHGVHHFLPMDRYRLLLPPVLFFPFSYGFYCLYLVVFDVAVAKAIFSGSLLGYMVYDLNHYYMHHGIPLTNHLRAMKISHNNHHYRNHDLGFGIISRFWDQVFDT